MKIGVTKRISQIILGFSEIVLKNVKSFLRTKKIYGALTMGARTTTSSICFDFVVAIGVGPVGLDRGRVNGVRFGHRGDVLDDSARFDEEEVNLQKKQIGDLSQALIQKTNQAPKHRRERKES